MSIIFLPNPMGYGYCGGGSDNANKGKPLWVKLLSGLWIVVLFVLIQIAYFIIFNNVTAEWQCTVSTYRCTWAYYICDFMVFLCSILFYLACWLFSSFVFDYNSLGDYVFFWPARIYELLHGKDDAK